MMRMAMVCLPLDGEAREAMLAQAGSLAEGLVGEGLTLTGGEFQATSAEMNGVVSREAKYLAKAMDALAYCDVAAFCDGWEGDACCRALHEAAQAGGVEVRCGGGE